LGKNKIDGKSILLLDLPPQILKNSTRFAFYFLSLCNNMSISSDLLEQIQKNSKDIQKELDSIKKIIKKPSKRN